MSPHAAEVLRIPVATLRWYRHLDIGPLSFKLGRHVMYRQADLFSWVDAQAEAARRLIGDVRTVRWSDVHIAVAGRGQRRPRR